jgi:hypothetical protein
MKLELLNKSAFLHNSLGERTLYNQFMEQMKQAVYFKLVDYLYEEIQINNYKAPILERLKSYERDGK